MGSFDESFHKNDLYLIQEEGYILSKWDKDRNKYNQSSLLSKQKHRQNCWHRMPFSQRQTLLLIFSLLLFFLLYSSSSVDVHMFLDLFYSPLFACRFSWLLFSSISQNDHPGSATLWQLRVHYFCHNWKRKCCLHFIVNYSWKVCLALLTLLN